MGWSPCSTYTKHTLAYSGSCYGNSLAYSISFPVWLRPSHRFKSHLASERTFLLLHHECLERWKSFFHPPVPAIYIYIAVMRSGELIGGRSSCDEEENCHRRWRHDDAPTQHRHFELHRVNEIWMFSVSRSIRSDIILVLCLQQSAIGCTLIVKYVTK